MYRLGESFDLVEVKAGPESPPDAHLRLDA